MSASNGGDSGGPRLTSDPPESPRSNRGLIIALIAVAAAALVVIAVVLIIQATGDDVPYTAEEMATAQLECDNEAQQARLFGGSDPDEAVMDCLRNELPEMSDDQLERLDYYIEQAGGTPL